MKSHLQTYGFRGLARRVFSSILLLLPFLFCVATAQSQVVAEIQHVYPREFQTDGFVLKTDQVVQIEAVGPMARRGRSGLANAWILDARTREVIWEFDASDMRERNSRVREVTDELSLRAGPYEVYYASFPYSYDDWREDEWEDYWDEFRTSGLGEIIRDVLDEIFDRSSDRSYYDWSDRYGREADNFGITITGSNDGYNERDRARLASDFEQITVLSLTNLDDDVYVHQGFELDRFLDLEVYAVGELQQYDRFDYGWIINAETRERVWEMEYHDTEHAGGADKNRVTNEMLSLPAGKYVAYYVTDGSHSAEEWNSAPPYDPFMWGLSLLVEDSADQSAVTLYDDETVRRENAFVSMIRMHGEDYESRGFTLNRAMDVRIYAIGEGRDGRMFDYGWINNADTYERVWEMEYADTEHAGGGEKNRLFDGVVFLEAGSYIAHYITDYGHNYGDWNTTEPYDQESYGLTILPADRLDNGDEITVYNESDDPAVLAQLIRIRDDVYRREHFTLEEETEVHIYALGEGRDGDMFDFGWIEDSRGVVVWEMQYRMTEHAGGGSKNRLVNTTISLGPGEYTLFYESDDSHSFEDWNTDPPADPIHWGITVRAVNRR